MGAHSAEDSRHNVQQRGLGCIEDDHDGDGRAQPQDIASEGTAAATVVVQHRTS